MTNDESGLLIATLSAAYPRQTLEPTTIEVYARSLTDLNADLATNAVMRLIASSVFFPSIAEIRTAAAETATNLPGPAAAWVMVGTKESRRTAPAAVKEALDAVGGSWALNSTTNLETFRAQFRRAYEEIRQRELDVILLAGCPAIETGKWDELEPGEPEAVATAKPATYGALPMGEEHEPKEAS